MAELNIHDSVDEERHPTWRKHGLYAFLIGLIGALLLVVPGMLPFGVVVIALATAYGAVALFVGRYQRGVDARRGDVA